MNTFFDCHDKLYALMKALEINNLDKFINGAQIKDYELLGQEMTKRIKLLRDRVDELESGLENFKKMLDL